jgi:hypothetical protein
MNFSFFPISLIGTKGTKSKKDVFELGRQSALKLTEQISRHRNHSNSRYNVLPQKKLNSEIPLLNPRYVLFLDLQFVYFLIENKMQFRHSCLSKKFVHKYVPSHFLPNHDKGLVFQLLYLKSNHFIALHAA